MSTLDSRSLYSENCVPDTTANIISFCATQAAGFSGGNNNNISCGIGGSNAASSSGSGSGSENNNDIDGSWRVCVSTESLTSPRFCHINANNSSQINNSNTINSHLSNDVTFYPQNNNYYSTNDNARYNMATQQQHLGNNDDMRVSKIIRRLLNDNMTSVTALELCKKLELAVRTPANASYIIRTFDLLLENMLSILQNCPTICLPQASNILGLMGYINRGNYQMYEHFIQKNYRAHKDLQKYLVLALKTTLSCDFEKHVFEKHSDRIMAMLKDCLENADNAETFIAVSQTAAAFSRIYRLTFEAHFQDIVDIVIGWHLEPKESRALKDHCACILQEFVPYFSSKLDFSYGLLSQFVEDIAALRDDMQTETCSLAEKADKSEPVAAQRVGAFIGAFNSLLKCLMQCNCFMGIAACETIVIEAALFTTSILFDLYERNLAVHCTETLENANELLCICVGQGLVVNSIADLKRLVETQLCNLELFEEEVQLTTLQLLLTVVRNMRGKLPSDFVKLIMEHSKSSLAIRLKMTTDSVIYKLMVRIHQEILLVKNVPLLQEAYKYLTEDIDACITCLKNAEAQGLADEKMVIAEVNLNFDWSALSSLATQTANIIGMYACDPSILQLLITNCRAADLKFWSNHVPLYQSLILLLVAHCRKNHNYRTTALLLRDDSSNNICEHTSPTAENFTKILSFLAQVLEQADQMNTVCLKILLDWTQSLLKECSERAHLLVPHPYFVRICKAIVGPALKMAPLESANCIEALLAYDYLSTELYAMYYEAALHKLDTFDEELHAAYTRVYVRLPPNVVLQPRPMRRHWQDKLTHTYRTGVCYAGIRDKHFKTLLETLETSSSNSKQQLRDVLRTCFTARVLEPESENDNKCSKFLQYTRGSLTMMSNWLQFEAARHCVDQKLRTAVGKPQQTFLAIEGIILKYARDLHTAKDSTGTASTISLTELLNVQKNLRMLLGFLEALEKLIYNAHKGCAYAYQVADKPVRTFFRLNASTCQAWFARIRAGVIMVALHSMEPELVVRHSEPLLQSLGPTDPAFNLALVHMTWALLCCSEADTLEGLAIWARAKCGKRLAWIQLAAEQAAGRKENAIAGYYELLSDGETDNTIKQFVVAQLLDCLTQTGQWAELEKFKMDLPGLGLDSINPLTHRENTELSKMQQILARYERETSSNETLLNALQELAMWPQSEGAVHCKSFSQLQLVPALEQSCMDQLLMQPATAQLSTDVQQALDTAWHDCLLAPSSSVGIRNQLILLKHITHALSQKQDNESALLHIMPNGVGDVKQHAGHTSTVLINCLPWLQLLPPRRTSENCAQALSSLYLNIATSARKEGNYRCSQRMLALFFKQRQQLLPLDELAAQLVNASGCFVDLADTELLRGYAELAKLRHVQNKTIDVDAINLGAALCLQIHEQMNTDRQSPAVVPPNYPSVSADMLLTLAEWLSVRNATTSLSNAQSLQRLLEALPPITASGEQHVPTVDKHVGRLLSACLQQREHCGEAWVTYGNWCYRWGKKIVEARGGDNISRMTQHDIGLITQAIGDDVELDEALVNQLVSTLNNHQLSVNSESSEDLEPQDDEYSTSTELLKYELRKLSALADKPESVIDQIITIWRQSNKSIYEFYESAARAYFRYLSLKAPSTEPDEPLQSNNRYHVDDSNMVTTTLRLLRLIVKHAVGLQEVLEEGLKATPIQPWKVIIPQLFSRLNHHEPYVRKSVSELLCRLANNRPQLVIFPAVVGANRELNNSELAKTSPSIRAQLTNCFGTLLSTLAKQAPQIVLHVQLLVKELKRVCLLWDEYWLNALGHIYGNYVQRMNALNAEFGMGDSEEKTVKFNAFRHQILADLEKVAAFTSRSPETSYEYAFKKRFEAEISQLMEQMRELSPSAAWDKLKGLYSVFQHNPIRGTSFVLKMSNLSPVLANMSKTDISMPGVDLYERDPIYIQSVESVVNILPTKTKPKKVAFLGSNGHKYTYLFKGLEDLHLDERIMQFISITNTIMACKNDVPTTTKSCFKAQHYSVIPLGPQSGLITWVDGVTPVFSIYKKWQQREAEQQRPKNANSAVHTVGNELNEGPPVVLPTKRLADLFYGKLTPLLAKYNIKITDSRKHWPLEALRQVLAELMLETPNDLLSKELWCHSINAADWRKSVRRYSMSMAVMSVIGYVIGLGDRHLDNILINLATGEIVHIDYNVCFEKGKTLRIPEKVPFRLTQNLEHALGITGTEGAFRLGCEYVLKAMRKERETLLTLLEAFVYDPLVDWTVGEDSVVHRRPNPVKALNAATSATSLAHVGMAKSVKPSSTNDKMVSTPSKRPNWDMARQTICAKLCELDNAWSDYRLEVCNALQAIAIDLQEHNDACDLRQQLAQKNCDLMQQMAFVHELGTLSRDVLAKHPFNTVRERYAQRQRDAAALRSLLSSVQQLYEPINRLLTVFYSCIESPTFLSRLNMQLIRLKFESVSWRSDYQMVTEVLRQQSPEAVNSYNQSRSELDEVLSRVAVVAVECVDQLQQYAAVMYYYPEAQIKRNAYVRFVDTYSQQVLQPPDECGATANDRVGDEMLSGEHIVDAADTMGRIWIELNCDLHQVTLHLDTKRSTQQSSVELAVSTLQNYRALDQSAEAALKLQLALSATISKSNEAFDEFEAKAVAVEDITLLQQQLNYIEVVLGVFQSIAPADMPNHGHLHAEALADLTCLQAVLQALLNLKESYQCDLPAYIFKLFLMNGSHKELNRLSCLNGETLYAEYCRERVAAQSNADRFLESLQPFCTQFEEFRMLFNKLFSKTRRLLTEMPHSDPKAYIQMAAVHKADLSELNIESFFGLICEGLKASSSYDVRSFAAPANAFILGIERAYLAGLTPFYARALWRKFNDQILQSLETLGITATPSIHDAELLCESLFVALQQNAHITQHQRHMLCLNKWIKLHTLASSAHHWANEKLLSANYYGHIIRKDKLLTTICSNMMALRALLNAAVSLQADVDRQVGEIECQKTNWNRNHIESFMRSICTQKRQINVQMGLSREVLDCASNVCTFEHFVHDTKHDVDQMLRNVELWNAAYAQWQCSSSGVSATEAALVELLDPESDRINEQWIRTVRGMLEERLKLLRINMDHFESENLLRVTRIGASATNLQKLLDTPFRQQIRGLISVTNKCERNAKNAPADVFPLLARVQDAHHLLKRFFAKLHEFCLLLPEVCADVGNLKNVLLLEKCHKLLKSRLPELNEHFSSTTELLQHNAESSSLPFEATNNVQNKPGLNPCEQKRNAYGVSVWKKIRMKLEGRDPDPNRRSTVAEQIDCIIKEATNMDNLAVLYEGWTPWV